MTTICTDGKTIAADTLATHGDLICQGPRKKLVCRDGRIFGWSGPTCFQSEWIDWYLAGAKPGTTLPGLGDDDDGNMLIVETDGSLKFALLGKTNSRVSEACYPMAVGSGRDFAMGAMVHGATAEDAVRVAMKLDPYSGGDVVVVTIPQKSFFDGEFRTRPISGHPNKELAEHGVSIPVTYIRFTPGE